MRKVMLIAIVAVAALSGCASQQERELNTWAEHSLAAAKAGQMKWSDYYSGLFDRVAALPSGKGKGETMNLIARMVEVSRLYEAGKLTREEFEQVQRLAKANAQQIDDALADRRRAAMAASWAAGFNSMGNAFRQNAQMYQQQAIQPAYTPPVTCDSRALSGGIQTVCR